jgi:hypothetical protein
MPATARKLPAAALAALLGFVLLAPARAADKPAVVPTQDEARVMSEDRTDSGRLERALQGLNWKQFRTVVEAVPKLKADVDAYGPAGWQYVKGKYKTYGWKKNIDRMDAAEKKKLAALIEAVQARR